MRFRLLFRWLLLLPVLVALLMLQSAHACELRVRRHPDASVYFQLPNGEVTGPQLEILREALRRMGCSTTLVDLPWARALRELEEGRLDVLPGAHRSAEREAYARFSRSDWPAHHRLFVQRARVQSQGQPKSLEDFLRKGRLGLQVGVSYGKEVDRLLQRNPGLEARIERVPQRRSLWQMLARGRVDGILADASAGWREAQELGLAAEIQATPWIVPAEPTHWAFSRKTLGDAFVARFDAAMESLERDGTRAAIRRRFESQIAPTDAAR